MKFFENMTLQQILKNPLGRVLSMQDIVDIHEELLEPFKVYGNVEQISKEHPKYLLESGPRSFNQRIKGKKVEKNGEGYILFEPDGSDYEQIELWHKVDKIHHLLVQLRLKQIQHTDSKNDLATFQSLENEIEQISREIEFLLAEPEYNFLNTHVERQDVSAPPENEMQRVNKVKLKASREKKRVVIVFNEQVKEILLGALKIGLSKLEFTTFMECFRKPSITTFGSNKHRKRPKIEIDIPALLDEVFEITGLFENRNLQKYFLRMVEIDAQKQNSAPSCAIVLLKFNKQFNVRKKAWEEKRSKEGVNTKITKSFHKAGIKRESDSRIISFLQFFNNDVKRLHSFFELLQDLQFIDEQKNYVYTGKKRDIAILFKALFELRDNQGRAIVKAISNRKKISRMILAEIKGLTDPYETLKKGFSTTDPQRIDTSEPTYVDFQEELKKVLI